MVRPFRPDDLHDLHAVTDVALHPDGGRVAYELSWPDRATDRNRTVVWLHGPDEHRPLTTAHRARRPRFSPDGRWLALLVSRQPDDRAQLAVLPLAGGELRVLTDLPDGVVDVVWCHGSDALVVEAPTRPPDQVGVDDDELGRRLRTVREQGARYNGRGWVHDRRHQLHVVALAGADDDGPAPRRQLTHTPRDATAPDVAPDGQVVFTCAGLADADLTGVVDLWLTDLDGSEPVRLTDGAGTWDDARWLGDGRLLARGVREVGVRFNRPWLLDPGSRRLDPLVGDDVNVVSQIGGVVRPVVLDDGALLPAPRRGAVHVDRYHLGGRPAETVVGGRVVVTCVAADGSGGRIVVGAAGPHHPAALFERAPDGELVPLADHDRELLAELDLAPVEELEVPSGDGSVVHAFVATPPPSAPPAEQGRRPGLVYVHGGPMAQYGWGFFDEFQVAAALGYVVVGGNPRGSDGYGEAWARGLVGDLGGPDWIDVQALTEALAGRPDVDPGRIGIGGGSYGGFMAAWAIGHSDRYGAALVERAVTNWETMTTTSDIGGWFVEAYLGADIDTDVEALRRQSPVAHARSAATPTLILHSEEDWRCPIEQAEQLFGILRRRAVEVTLVRVPGEDHELSRSGRPSRRVDRFTTVHDFFARHLGGGRAPGGPAPAVGEAGAGPA